MGTSGGPAVVATAAQMVAGHVVLDVSRIDRLHRNGYAPNLQTAGGGFIKICPYFRIRSRRMGQRA